MDGFPIMGVPDTGDTAWMLASAALVLLMTPGLAFFYGGMVRAKGVLNMLMMSISAMGVVTVLWVLYGYSMAFGNDVQLRRRPDAVLGPEGADRRQRGCRGRRGSARRDRRRRRGEHPAGRHDSADGVRRVPADVRDHHRRPDLRCGRRPPEVRQLAACSPACGRRSSTSRSRTGCSPSTAYTGETGGWIANKLKAIDFAGGTAVHINSGAAGLALCLVLGKRKGWPGTPMRPHNLPFVMLGAGLLWFGWYGFNAGSAVSSGGIAGATFVTTTVATAAAMLAWLLDGEDPRRPRHLARCRIGHRGRPRRDHAVLFVGERPWRTGDRRRSAACVCALAVGLKFKLGFDDSLDVVGVHLVGGLTGTLLIGLFATQRRLRRSTGLFYGGGFDQLWQAGRRCVRGSRLLVHRDGYLGLDPEVHHWPAPR